MVVPPNIEEASPTAKQQGPSIQQQLKGQQSFRWLRNSDDSIAGTMTVELGPAALTWHRPGGHGIRRRHRQRKAVFVGRADPRSARQWT